MIGKNYTGRMKARREGCRKAGEVFLRSFCGPAVLPLESAELRAACCRVARVSMNFELVKLCRQFWRSRALGRIPFTYRNRALPVRTDRTAGPHLRPRASPTGAAAPFQRCIARSYP